MSAPPRDPWLTLGARTPARIAIGRAGVSLPTREVLAFAMAHAKARDAVHSRLDRSAIAIRLAKLGLETLDVESQAANRQVYLRRPDLGRRLDPVARRRLCEQRHKREHGEASARADPPSSCDVALVIGDGLSALAVAAHAPPLVEALVPHLSRLGLRLGVVTLAEGARVALGDEIGQILGARLVAVLIGERPGLSAADSLSAYLTFAPNLGLTDAERNCLSNIRPEGLAPDLAAQKLAWLIEAALTLGATGVALKDRSDEAGLDAAKPAAPLANAPSRDGIP